MPELRWTLLIIGVLFVVILAWWERRRPHQASRQAPHISGEPRPVVGNDPSWGPDVETTNSRMNREPTLTLPEIRADVRPREPTAPRELPVVEIPHDAVIGMRVEGERIGEGIAERAVARESFFKEAAAREVAARESFSKEAIAQETVTREAVTREAVTEKPAAGKAFTRKAFAADEFAEDELAEEEANDEELEGEEAIVPSVASTPATEPEKARVAPPPPPPPLTPAARPIVDWPPEDQRKLVSLRLVARPPDRFQGRLVRQALAAEGFVLGDLDIFHKPDAQNRAVLSAASLTKPGTFDLDTMDTQRFVGLNLFAVLPGPKTPQKAFEDLLLTARMLNERLEGALQDERGGPLTPTRIQALRDALGAEAKS